MRPISASGTRRTTCLATASPVSMSCTLEPTICGDQRPQERIVGAAEHDGVGAALDQRPRIARDELARRGARELAGLDLLDEARARLRDDLDVAGVLLEQRRKPRALDRADRREHADDTAARGGDGRLHGGLHRDDREFRTARAEAPPPRPSPCCRRSRRLPRLRRMQELREHERALANVVGRLVAVRHVARVGDVEQRQAAAAARGCA